MSKRQKEQSLQIKSGWEGVEFGAFEPTGRSDNTFRKSAIPWHLSLAVAEYLSMVQTNGLPVGSSRVK
ncbi:hypothetical protein V6N13_112438 [Hibiscus sabdariffa]|uniref:Uncharacterized protein n=1 Tax=Hibiscus sabdariffa TaxID=183260 RepID=A0ABR2TN89_9ROSI